MLKVFFIIYTHSNGGGAENLLTMVMNGLHRTGRYELGMMEIVHYGVKKETLDEGIKVYPYYVREDALDRRERMYYVYRDWDRVISKYIPLDYDVYVSFNYLTPTFLLPKGKRNVAWIHGDVYDLINKYPFQVKKMTDEIDLQRESFKKVDRIVAISDITEQSIRDVFPECVDKLCTIYNGIDIARVHRMAENETDIFLKKPALVSVGRLDVGKQPLRLLDIYKKLRKQRSDVNLYYLGDGVLRDELEQEIEKSSLGDCVHLLGYLQNPYPIIRQANMMVMTSLSEGFPVSLMEGLALGVPFVSTVVGGSRILADNQTAGRTFETDEEAVDDIIQLLEEDKDKIKGWCESSINRFSLESYIGKIEQLFAEVMMK